MMDTPPAPSPQLFFDAANAYRKTAALKAAVELGLFSAIGHGSATAAELASECGGADRGIRILSDYLTILGFLTKQDDRYALTRESAAILDRNSPAYLGGVLDFVLAPELVDNFQSLSATIRTGRIEKSELGTTAREHPIWIKFARVMGPMVAPVAKAAAELVTLDPGRDTRILDVSASHGAFGIALARRNPRARIVALDWPAVLAVTEENARAAGLGERFEKISGSAFTVDLGADYDAILLPNFLHHFSRANCVGFLRRAHAALRPGGQVVLIEFVPNDDRITPPEAAAFSLVMLGTTPEGDAYTFTEYAAMLAEAGFETAPLQPILPTAQSVIVARK